MTTSADPRTENPSAASARSSNVQPCNFRYAGRLSNDNARVLTALHEKFALQAANSLEVYLGSSTHVRFVSLEQTVSGEYAALTRAEGLLLPCPLGVLESSFLIEMDALIVLPIIDLLLGGAGATSEQARELTEIDEDIMEPVGAVLVKELERSWKALNLTLNAGRCIKPLGISQIFPSSEKLVLMLFEVTVAGVSASMKVVLPTSFVGYLLRHLRAAQSKKVSNVRQLHRPTLRERLLDSTFVVAAEQTQLRVLVREILGLRAGMVLHLQAPIRQAGKLTVEGFDIFESMVVRNGKNKAAQLVGRSQEPSVERE